MIFDHLVVAAKSLNQSNSSFTELYCKIFLHHKFLNLTVARLIQNFARNLSMY